MGIANEIIYINFGNSFLASSCATSTCSSTNTSCTFGATNSSAEITNLGIEILLSRGEIMMLQLFQIYRLIQF